MIRVAVFGCGNLGLGVAAALTHSRDMVGIGLFTRRAPQTIHSGTGLPVFPAEEIVRFRDAADVVILCGGSATDLPEQTPRLAREFNVLDSFDTHARIGEHFAATDKAAREGGHLALLSAGWDPGLFSLARLLGEAVLPEGETATFWGRGVSQGHSQAVRRIEGVEDAREYTLPVPEAAEAFRCGRAHALSDTQCHRRECFVVPKEGADRTRIERQIREMPCYFAGYETTVHFIDRAAMEKEHSGLPHGGCVMRRGRIGETPFGVQPSEETSCVAPAGVSTNAGMSGVAPAGVSTNAGMNGVAPAGVQANEETSGAPTGASGQNVTPLGETEAFPGNPDVKLQKAAPAGKNRRGAAAAERHAEAICRANEDPAIAENAPKVPGATMTFSLSMDSNPAFTAGILLAYARALVRKFRRGERGAVTVFDVAPIDLLPCSAEEARRRFL